MQAEEKDRRFKRLSLTSEGKKLEARLTGAQMKLLNTVFTATGDRTQAAWKTVMREMSQRAGVKVLKGEGQRGGECATQAR